MPANQLPFCDAAQFSNEERIKAWSFCDYMMRRNPELLRTMDQIDLHAPQQRAQRRRHGLVVRRDERRKQLVP